MRTQSDRERLVLSDLRSKILTFEADAARSEDQLRATRDAINQEEQRRVNITAAISKNSDEASRLQRELLAAQRKLALTVRQEEESSKRCKDAELTLARLKAEAERASLALTEDAGALQTLRVERDALLSSIESTKKELKSLKEDHSISVTNVQSARMLWSQAESQRQSALEELNRLLLRCKEEEDRCRRTQENIAHMEDRMTSLYQEVAVAEEVAAKSRKQLEIEERRLEDRRRALQVTQEVKERMEAEVESAKDVLNRQRLEAMKELGEMNTAKQGVQAQLFLLEEVTRRRSVSPARERRAANVRLDKPPVEETVGGGNSNAVGGSGDDKSHRHDLSKRVVEGIGRSSDVVGGQANDLYASTVSRPWYMGDQATENDRKRAGDSRVVQKNEKLSLESEIQKLQMQTSAILQTR